MKQYTQQPSLLALSPLFIFLGVYLVTSLIADDLLNSSYKCNGIHINNLFKFFVWCEVSKSFTRSII